MDTWDQSAGATLIEQRLIRWTAERLGLGPDADGVFTSGGTTSNLQALLIARNHAVAELRRDPRRERRTPAGAAGRLRIFASEASHFSISKSASLLGLGDDAVVSIAVRRPPPDGPDSAAGGWTRAPHAEKPHGHRRHRRHHRLRQHRPAAGVRGAWPANTAPGSTSMPPTAAGCSPRCGTGTCWTESSAADSVTVDYHKTFFQPVSSSALLVRDAAMLRHVTALCGLPEPGNAPPANDPEPGRQEPADHAPL